MSMTVRSFAALHDVDERTVQRWLKAGKLPGAVKTSRGWVIPADAAAPGPDQVPAAGHATGTVARTTTALATPAAPALPQGGGLSAYLETLPAYVPLDLAATLMGIRAGVIRNNRERFGVQPWGERGAGSTLVVPKRVIREADGARPE